MKRVTFFLLVNILCFHVLAQVDTNPRVIVLYPNEIIASDEILEELKTYEKKVEVTQELRNKYVNDQLSENWKTIRMKELEFIANQDFCGNMTFRESSSLIYEVYAYESYPLIYPVRDTSPLDAESFQEVAEKYDVSWVINISKLDFSKNGNKQLNASIQLYNTTSDRIFINKNFTGDTSDPGGNLACQEGSWECAANNIVKLSTIEIFDILDKYRKYW